MAKEMNFTALDDEPKTNETRWQSREPDRVLQMSVRMHRSEYEAFRKLCADERRTNGDMVATMLKHYLKHKRKADPES